MSSSVTSVELFWWWRKSLLSSAVEFPDSETRTAATDDLGGVLSTLVFAIFGTST